MNKLSLLLAITLTILFGILACDSTDSDGEIGRMKVVMTDAPANYDSVLVTVNEVRVHKNKDAETDTTENGEGDWVVIMDDPITVNLLELTNGNQVSLGTEELETGHYSQMRFVLGDDNTVTVDGETHNLQTPSGQQSGLKLNIDTEIEENVQHTLLVDFDAARSIVEQGNGGYLLKPVLRAVNLAEAGSIVGNVQPTDFKTNVIAVMDEDTIASTITNDNGDFAVMGLLENSYEVIFDPDSDEYADSTQTDIEVTAGEEIDLGTIELESNSN